MKKLYKLDDLLELETKSNELSHGQFDPIDKNFDEDVPKSLIRALRMLAGYNEIVQRELSQAFGLQKRRKDERFASPIGFIGHSVVKKSGKPFKGGADVVIIDYICEHPKLPGQYAAVYKVQYPGQGTIQSYIHVNQIRPYFGE